jgi:phage protein U
MIGYFGDIIFETSDSKILNFSGFKLEASARFSNHETIGRQTPAETFNVAKYKPKTEYIGPNLKTVSFSITLNGNFGVKPREEMEKWISLAENGRAELLVIGGVLVGDDFWVVKSVSEAWDVIFNNGELFSGKIDVTLEEYIAEVQ